MLVLTRKLQEKICIGNDITVTILRVKGQQVRIGIEAPRDVRVIRGELPPLAKEREQPLASGGDQEEGGSFTLEFEGTLAADSGSDSADEEVSAVLTGRGRPLAMQKFVQTVLEGALAK